MLASAGSLTETSNSSSDLALLSLQERSANKVAVKSRIFLVMPFGILIVSGIVLKLRYVRKGIGPQHPFVSTSDIEVMGFGLAVVLCPRSGVVPENELRSLQKISRFFAVRATRVCHQKTIPPC